ncbi:MAG: helix-turn-helix domain-containing protein [Parcubacteria group bacterium]|nr:helix-turn-helix domain-containing protein [Parcubacteria group bacterium]
MASFVSKPILTSQTIGEQLCKAREGAGLSLADLSRTLRIKAAYLEAIELGSYSELPGEIYALEFTRRYAAALRMDPGRAVERHRLERAAAIPPKQAWHAFHRQPLMRFKAQRLFRAGAACVGAGAIVYAFVFGRAFFGPPELEIATPGKYQEIGDFRVVVQGQARGAQQVLLNGELVQVQRDGSFTQALTLPRGYHVLRITALGRGGRAATEFRVVRVRADAPDNLVLHNNN